MDLSRIAYAPMLADQTDAEKAAEYLQTIPNFILAAVATGRVDLKKLAAQQLAGRGRDITGKWLGFEAAAAALAVKSEG